jgi:hypothetical protein
MINPVKSSFEDDHILARATSWRKARRSDAIIGSRIARSGVFHAMDDTTKRCGPGQTRRLFRGFPVTPLLSRFGDVMPEI